MTLANYLETPQARADVRALLTDSPAREIKLGTGRRWQKPAGHASIKAQGFEVDTMLTLNKREAWSQIRLSQRDDEMAGAMVPRVTAYYRPDGERFVVTDMGEGVRARALRTGEVGGPMHSDSPCQIAEAASCMPRGTGNRTWVDGALYAEGIEAKELPDAICRVMLASLRVAHS